MVSDDKAANRWFERKSAMMEKWLGKEHDLVMHAIIPYAIGGGLDLYFYPNGIPGTAFATKELSEAPGEGSTNDVFRNYELVMFTKHKLDLDVAFDTTTEFGRAYGAIQPILNGLAPYSAIASLNPNETCEFPAEMERVGGRCLIFDGYPTYFKGKQVEFGLLAAIEIFRSEMEFAMQQKGRELLQRLRDHHYYPYSDLDRKPVA